MAAENILAQLGAMIASGGIQVVDCSGTLGPETPLLKLPPDFAAMWPHWQPVIAKP